MDFNQTRYLTSANHISQQPPDEGAEAAFAGRSNAGKSSAINILCGQKGLARISKAPGRTQMLNFFAVAEAVRLVDLPGYGYAKVPERIQRHWQSLMEQYLSRRNSLRGMIIIMDIRHPLSDYDWQMLEWCSRYGLPGHILLTKSDKLKRGPRLQAARQVEQQLLDRYERVSLQTFSALKRDGVEQARLVLQDWLDQPGDPHP